VHSFVDWTWFVPGNAVVALIAAGWVVGRGPLRRNAAAQPVPPLALRPRQWIAERWRTAAAAAAVLIALVTAWAAWQPLRSLNASNDGLAALERNDLAAARADAEKARRRDPLALDPLTVLAIVETRQGHKEAALRTLEREVQIQPANNETWLRLADFQLNRLNDPKAALRSLRAALYLDPRDALTISAYLQVARRLTGKTPKVVPPPTTQPPATQPPGSG